VRQELPGKRKLPRQKQPGNKYTVKLKKEVCKLKFSRHKTFKAGYPKEKISSLVEEGCARRL